MKIGIFGRGRLGTAIAAAAREELAWCVGRTAPPDSLVDVMIDASAGEAVSAHLDLALARGTNLVLGTTGWQLPDLNERVGTRIGVVVAPNFSLSVALLARLSRVLGRFAALEPRFDPYILEHHHARKKDAPSGTARLLARVLLEACPKKTSWRLAGERSMEESELCIGVLRAGATYSSHVVGFDAPEEVLEIRHESRSAAAYAAGALVACRWVRGRKGVFSMDEVAADVLDPLFVT